MKIKGVEFSEATIVGWAEQAGISFEPKPYRFEAGDVAVNKNGIKRIIVYAATDSSISSYDSNGYRASKGQEQFEKAGYKKIGVISDFIK